MPTVQRYGGRKVATAALPGVRKSAAETDLSTGAGLAHAEGQAAALKADALGRLGGTAMSVGMGLGSEAIQIRAAETKRANDVASLEWSNKLDTWQNETLYSSNGALTRKGKDAQGLPEEVGEAFEKVVSEIGGGLSNPDQQFMFAKEVQQRRENLDATVYRHAFREQQTYEASELKSYVDNKVNAAVLNANDPRAVGQQLAAGVQKLKASLPRMGAGPEEVAQQVRTFESAALEGVIMQQLAEEKPAAAAAYFEEAKEGGIEFDDKALTRITTALNVGKVRSAAQKATAEILAAGGTLNEQRAKAKSITDPEVQDEVDRRLLHEDGIRKVQEREAEATLLTDAYTAVDQTGDVDQLPPATIAQLGTHLPALRAYAEKRSKGEPIETDWREYLRLKTLAADDPAAFIKENIWKFRGRSDDPEFKEITSLYAAVKSGDRKKTDDVLAGFRTHHAIVTDTLYQYTKTEEKNYTPAQLDAKANLMRLVDQWTAQEQAAGRKVTNPQIQEHLDEILSNKTTARGSWLALIRPFKYDLFDKPGKFLIEQKYDDISESDRAQLEAALRANRQPVTPTTVLDLYLSIHSKRAK